MSRMRGCIREPCATKSAVTASVAKMPSDTPGSCDQNKKSPLMIRSAAAMAAMFSRGLRVVGSGGGVVIIPEAWLRDVKRL